MEITIMGMTPEELVEKVESGKIDSRTYSSFDEFYETLKK